MQEAGVALARVATLVLGAGLARAAARRHLQRPAVAALALELLGALQLGGCTHELVALGARGPAWAGAALVYALSLVHARTLAGAAGNPCTALQDALLGALSPSAGAARLAAQVAGALCSRPCVRALRGLGPGPLSDFGCRDPIRAGLPAAVLTEAACSGLFHGVLLLLGAVRAPIRAHLLAALTTLLVHAGGGLTGALFNPALALALHLTCFAEDFLRFFLVYWLAPCLECPDSKHEGVLLTARQRGNNFQLQSRQRTTLRPCPSLHRGPAGTHSQPTQSPRLMVFIITPTTDLTPPPPPCGAQITAMMHPPHLRNNLHPTPSMKPGPLIADSPSPISGRTCTPTP
ncbi:aquaporin-11 [Ctenodactylus gundi]